jgi:hypothetical protein
LVTIGVLSLLLTAFTSINSTLPNQRNSIRGDIVEILNLYSNARSMAINSTTVETGAISIVPQFGYGVHVDISDPEGKKFTFFADTNQWDDEGVTRIGNGKYDKQEDTIFSTTSYFNAGVYQNTKLSFIVTPGTNKEIKEGGDNEITVLFAPLSAQPTIAYENNPSDTGYTDMKIQVLLEGVIEEEIRFNTTSRFFERTQIFP